MSDVGGNFSSLVTDKHPSYKRALKHFKKNALIKMYFANEKAKANKDELVKKTKITEALQVVKFRYMSARHDPVPEVKVLDTEYPGAEGQKTYGQRQDILGWNLNYFENKKEAKKTIDEIDDFAKILGADKKQKYERIKMLFPEQALYLRRYIKDNCKGVKIKEEGLWRPADWDEIKHLNTQSF